MNELWLHRLPQHQDRRFLKARLPEQPRLPRFCHREMVDAVFPHQLRHLDNAQAIAIALEDRPDNALPGLLPDRPDVLRQVFSLYDVSFHPFCASVPPGWPGSPIFFAGALSRCRSR